MVRPRTRPCPYRWSVPPAPRSCRVSSPPRSAPSVALLERTSNRSSLQATGKAPVPRGRDRGFRSWVLNLRVVPLRILSRAPPTDERKAAPGFRTKAGWRDPGWSIGAMGLPDGPKMTLSGTIWSVSGMRRADQDPGGDRSWGVVHLHPARFGSVRDRQGTGRCGHRLAGRPRYRGCGTRTTHEADKPRHSGARRVPPFRPRDEGEGERAPWRPGGARKAHPHHSRHAYLAHR